MALKILLTHAQADFSDEGKGSLIEKLHQQGVAVKHLPVFLFKPIDGPLSASSPLKLMGQEHLVFITRLSVEVFKKSGIALPQASRCFAIGSGTAETFRHYFPHHSIQSPVGHESQNSEGLLALPEFGSCPRVFIFRGDSGREFLAETLRARGVLVEYVKCYERSINPDFHRFWTNPQGSFLPDLVVLTSAESLKFFLECSKQAEVGSPWITVLPGRMEALAREYGYPNILPMESASNEGVLKAVSSF